MQHAWNATGPGLVNHPAACSEGGACLSEDREAVVLSFDLENDPALIPEVIARVMDVVERLRLFDDATAQRVGVALHEAILNGIHHGNLELDSALRVEDERTYQRLASRRRRMLRYKWRQLHVQVRCDPAGAAFVIRDEGCGFDPTQLPDLTDPTILERPCGRGLIMIRAYMDEVSFNATGNEISLFKRRTDRPSAVAK
jgi:Histidine kinase-like ATPase domain